MRWTELRMAGAAIVLHLGAIWTAAAAEPLPIRLLDGDGNPVAHARVTVVGRAGAVTTDAAGLFVLSPEPVPPFDLAVFDRSGAWLGQLRVERLGQEGVRDLYLPLVEKVEVSARSGVAPSTLAPPAAAATVVSRADHEQRETDRLTDVVAEIPGAGHVGSGHAAVPALRGLARGRTLLLLDGGRVTSERRAGPSATFLDPFVLEQVEVVRGAGSVVYGSDALGGVIHARSANPDPRERALRFEATAGFGEDLAAGGIEANLPLGSGGILVAAHARDFDNYRSPRGEVLDSGASDRGVLLKGLVPAGGARWIAALQIDRAEDVGKPREDPAGSRTSYPVESSERLTLAVDLPPPGRFTGLEINAFFGRYRLVTDREEPLATGEELFRSDIEADDASLRLLATRPLDRGALRLGLDARARFGLSARDVNVVYDDQGEPLAREEAWPIESARQLDAGLFVEAERLLGSGRSSLAAGLRATRVSTHNEDGAFGTRSTDDATLSGYLACTFRPATPWSAVIQVARGFREPFLSDRYFTGVTGRGFITGNPDLEPETSRQLDLSLRRSGGVASFAAYGYLYRIEDLIERFRMEDGTFSWRNRGEEEIVGLEGEAAFDLGADLTLRLSAGWARGEILDDGTPAADIPPLSGNVTVHHRPAPRVWWRASAGLFARDDRPGEAEAETPGRAVLDAAVGFEVLPGLEARLLLGNLLDQSYPDSADDDSVLAPGQSAMVVLAGSF